MTKDGNSDTHTSTLELFYFSYHPTRWVRQFDPNTRESANAAHPDRSTAAWHWYSTAPWAAAVVGAVAPGLADAADCSQSFVAMTADYHAVAAPAAAYCAAAVSSIRY